MLLSNGGVKVDTPFFSFFLSVGKQLSESPVGLTVGRKHTHPESIDNSSTSFLHLIYISLRISNNLNSAFSNEKLAAQMGKFQKKGL